MVSLNLQNAFGVIGLVQLLRWDIRLRCRGTKHTTVCGRVHRMQLRPQATVSQYEQVNHLSPGPEIFQQEKERASAGGKL